MSGREPPKVNELLTAVEQTSDFSHKILSRLKREKWKETCAFTHTGGSHIQRWTTQDAIQPNYDLLEITIVLKFAETIGALSATGIAELAGDDSLPNEILEKFRAA